MSTRRRRRRLSIFGGMMWRKEANKSGWGCDLTEGRRRRRIRVQ